MLGNGEHALYAVLRARAAAVARCAGSGDVIAVVRGLDEWGVSALALVLVDEFQREAPTLGEIVIVRRDSRSRYGVRVERGADVDEARL